MATVQALAREILTLQLEPIETRRWCPIAAGAMA
jgi:hypothetical protein